MSRLSWTPSDPGITGDAAFPVGSDANLMPWHQPLCQRFHSTDKTLAVHSPDPKDGQDPNPHFHVMATMRPLNPDGSWGEKQRREYVLDENGERVPDSKAQHAARPQADEDNVSLRLK